MPETAVVPVVNKAGLLFTAELEFAIDLCRKKVQRISRQCRRENKKYRDADFDLVEDKDRCLHGLPVSGAERYEPVEAMRVTEIFEKPEFFIGGASASDVAQGKAGNCWFLSALCVTATAGLIEQICVERDEQVGVYGFIFWRDSGWVDVIIDDLLFVILPRWHELTDRERIMCNSESDIFRNQVRRGGKALYFSSSKTANETWVPLIEKAYAKLHGDYSSLASGWVDAGVEDMTGGVISRFSSKDILDKDRFWTNELSHANADRVFGIASFNNTHNYFKTLDGIILEHSYSVIKVAEYNGKRFVRVRNPWGKTEGSGPWSDGSKEWTEEWFPALKALDYKFGNDGEFVMEYSDFLATWDVVNRCRLFDEKWTVSQLWLNVDCGDFRAPIGFGHVSFTLALSQPTEVVIALAQLDTRYFKGLESNYGFALSFTIFKAGDDEPLGTSDQHWRFKDRSVNLEMNLDEGDYVIQVRIDKQQTRDEKLHPPLDKRPTTETVKQNNQEDVEPLHTTYKRKYGQKYSQMVYSSSIAANFDAASYENYVPLPANTFAGLDITAVELEAHKRIKEHEAVKKAHYSSDAGIEPAPVSNAPQLVQVQVESTVILDAQEIAEPVSPGSGSGSFSNITTPSPAGSEGVLVANPSDEVNVDVDGHTEQVATGAGSGSPGEYFGEGATYVPTDSPPAAEGQHTDLVVATTVQSDGGNHAITQTTAVAVNNAQHSKACDGCGVNPIVGSAWVCLDVVCFYRKYTLCEGCVKKSAHPHDHRMIELDDKEDWDRLDAKTLEPEESNAVVVGLRVYALKECNVQIKGQLRHGNLVRKYLSMPKML